MAPKISAKTVEKFLESVPWKKVVVKGEKQTLGGRVYPSQTEKNDKASNFRLDRVHDVDGKAQLVMQPNKQAENKGVQEEAQRDSHQTLVKATIDPRNDSKGEKTREDLFQYFKGNKVDR